MLNFVSHPNFTESFMFKFSVGIKDVAEVLCRIKKLLFINELYRN